MHDVMAPDLLDDLLGPLHMHFHTARNAYGDYLASGRRFLFACSLRRINESARELLIRKAYLLPAELQIDAAALIAHYDAWLTLWIDQRRQTNPRPDDAFAFENARTYPRDAERRLDALYETLSACQD